MNMVARSRIDLGSDDAPIFLPVRGRNRAPAGSPMSDSQGVGIAETNRGSLTLSAVDFCGWLGQAAPGDAIVYHTGFLSLDRIASNHRLSSDERAELGRLASCVLRAAAHAVVHLVQRRHACCCFTYVAIARVRPKAVPASLAFLMPEVAE